MSLLEQNRPPSVSRRRFTKEFKADAVALVLDRERPIAHIARDLGIGETNLGYLVRQARADRGEREGTDSSERWEPCLFQGRVGVGLVQRFSRV